MKKQYSLFDWNHDHADRLLMICDDGTQMTYGEGEAFSRQFGKITEKRALTAILCKNCAGSVLIYLAAMRNGIVPVLLDQGIQPERLADIMVRYEIEYLAMPEEVCEKHKAAAVQKEVIYTGYGYSLFACEYADDMEKRDASIENFDGITEKQDASMENSGSRTAVYEALALLLSTSGSTGSPKLVRQSYENIQSNAAAICEYLSIKAQDRPITTLPMNYTYGLSIINSHVLMGCTLLLTTCSVTELGFWEFLQQQKATTFGGVPYTYEMLNRLRFQRMQLDSIKIMTQAGGRLNPVLQKELCEYAAKTGKQFIIMYGQTEATARMAYLPWERAMDKLGSIGIAIPGGQFFIGNDDELIYKGPNVTLGYAQCRADLKKEDERQGILCTGDLARKDADGFYYIVGRKKRFIKLYGNRINLDEVEEMLRANILDGGFACVGKDDRMHILVDTAGNAYTDEIVPFLQNALGINGRCFYLHVVEKIPRNTSGKTDYGECGRICCIC